MREAILDLTAIVTGPRPDALLIEAAGVELDRALLPLLSRIERHGALSIKELANLVGRDYTTVSRQVTKLETSGLAKRRVDPTDGRVVKAALTDAGLAVTRAIDRARQKQLRRLMQRWSDDDSGELLRLTRMLSDDLGDLVQNSSMHRRRK